MQPDNIRPAARIPNFAFSDMTHFQLKVAAGAMFLRWNCDDSARPLWWKRIAIPAFRWSLRAAAGWVWHFCRAAGTDLTGKKRRKNRRFFKIHIGSRAYCIIALPPPCRAIFEL